jgi:predicted nucleotidyltransferase
MSRLALVTARLRERSSPFALIGATAMAAHGVSRATLDLDLFTVDQACLGRDYWAGLDLGVDQRRGGPDDPLAGVVRVGAGSDLPIDIVVGRSPWQAAIPARARPSRIEGVEVPVASREDLILLKLYAGAPQDAWDVAQLLQVDDPRALIAEVEGRLADLPPACATLWRRIAAGGQA